MILALHKGLKQVFVFGRRHIIDLQKGAVEASDASKAGGKGDFCDAHIARLQQIGGMVTTLTLKVIMESHAHALGAGFTECDRMCANGMRHVLKSNVFCKMQFDIVNHF